MNLSEIVIFLSIVGAIIGAIIGAVLFGTAPIWIPVAIVVHFW